MHDKNFFNCLHFIVSLSMFFLIIYNYSINIIMIFLLCNCFTCLCITENILERCLYSEDCQLLVFLSLLPDI